MNTPTESETSAHPEPLRSPYAATTGKLTVRGTYPGLIDTVTYDGVARRAFLYLSKRPMFLLDMLARESGRVVLKHHMMEALYRGTPRYHWPLMKNIDVFIWQVRRGLRAAFGNDEVARLIRTVWGLGYALSTDDISVYLYAGVRPTSAEKLNLRGFAKFRHFARR